MGWMGEGRGGTGCDGCTGARGEREATGLRGGGRGSEGSGAAAKAHLHGSTELNRLIAAERCLKMQSFVWKTLLIFTPVSTSLCAN